MAITAANLTASFDNTDAQSYNTASVTPGANRLILVAVGIRNYSAVNLGTITLSGNGLTWVEVATTTYSSVASSQSRISVFRSMGTSPSAGAITITVSGSGNASCQWAVDEFNGVDTTGTNGSGAVVQSATNRSDNCTSGLTITLAALADAVNNAVFAAFGTDDAQNLTEGSGYTELSAVVGEDALETQWKLPGTTTPNATNFASFGDGAGIAIEIKASAGGPTSHALSATAASAANTVGALILSLALAGSAASASASSGQLRVGRSMSASAVSVSTISGSLIEGLALNGASAGVSSTAGALSIGGAPTSHALNATAAGTSTTTGALSLGLRLTGSVASVSTVSTAALLRGVPISGTAGSTSATAAALLSRGHALSGTSTGASVSTGTATAGYALRGTATTTSTVVGALGGGTAVVPVNLVITVSTPRQLLEQSFDRSPRRRVDVASVAKRLWQVVMRGS